jgi:hypothetical protein
MRGALSVLNVGAGDTKLTFDKNNPVERLRAARIVTDMIRRGYALLVEVDDGKGGKAYQRAHAFREDTCEYIVADFDPLAAQPEDTHAAPQATEPLSAPTPSTGLDDGPPLATRKRGRPRARAIAAESANAVAVARTAGG